MFLFLLLAADIARTTGAYDEVRETEDGRVLVMRTISWDIRPGQAEIVTVHWLLQDDGSMRYDFDRQPTATQDVHRRACAAEGMEPSRGVSELSGEGASHGYTCTHAQ